MDNSKCNICQSPNAQRIFRKNDFWIVKCHGCGVLRVETIPSETEALLIYNDRDHRWDLNRQKYIKESEAYSQKQKDRFFRDIKKVKINKGKLLDVGCGGGFFLKCMEEIYSQVTGIEVSMLQVEFAQKIMKLNVIKGTLQTAKFPEDLFDTITFWDVLEHVVDPLTTLQEARKILKKDGLIAVSTPNAGGITATFTKESWLYYSPPQHLHFFTPKTLKLLLRKAGFTILKVRTENIYFNNIIQSLRQDYKITPKEQRTSIADFSSKIEGNRILVLIKNFINLGISHSSWGDILFAYALKS